jgi:hypothetical protein
LVRQEFHELRGISSENMLFIKEDVIIPHVPTPSTHIPPHTPHTHAHARTRTHTHAHARTHSQRSSTYRTTRSTI